jgi:hypothetical protein
MGKFFKTAGNITEVIEAAKHLDWAKAGKDFIGPSMAIGGAAGLTIGALTGGLKDENGNLNPGNMARSAAAGIAVDAGTGLGQAIWKRRNEIKENPSILKKGLEIAKEIK